MADLKVYMIIDGSGSMGGVKHDVVRGINDFIDEQKDDAKATGDDILFTLTSFDDKVSEVYDAEDITLVNHITDRDTFRGGSTALYDAIGRTLSKADTTDIARRLVVVYTDGYENASREYTADQVKKLIEDFQATGNWTFVYMSAELADFAQPQSLGFTGNNTLTGTNRNATYGSFQRVSSGAIHYRGASATTAGAVTQDFYRMSEDVAVTAGVPTASLGGTIGMTDAVKTVTKVDVSDPGDETDVKDDNAS